MKYTLITLAFTAATLGVTGAAAAQMTQAAQPPMHSSMQQKGPEVDIPAKLRAKAKISETAARATAAAKVPNGTIQAVELEEEDGKLQYSYDIKVAGKTGIEEVNIDAINGSVIAVQHESPASLQKEAAADRKAVKPSH